MNLFLNNMICCSSVVREGAKLYREKVSTESATPTPQVKKIASDAVQSAADAITSGSTAGGLEKVDTYGMLMGTSQTAGGFTKTLTNITTELNSVFVILRTLVFIIAICLIYLGLFQYAKANGGQGESEAKQTIKKAVLVILILASLSSVILLVYSIAQTLVFV